MATTSGVAGTLQYTVAEAVDEAFRRCGKLPSTVSAEQLESAKFNLWQILTNYANDGLSLWCVRDYLLPQVEGRSVYTLPGYLVDVLAVQYQRYAALTPSSVTTPSTAVLQLEFAEAVNPQMLQIITGVPSANMVVEYQDATSAWVTVAALMSTELTASVEAQPATFWRVRDTTGAALTVGAIALYGVSRETPITQVNRDDYLTQPTKYLKTSGEAQQWWFRKSTPPQLAFTWASDAAVGGYRVTVQRQIQDVTALSQLVDCPQRWYAALVARLAEALCMIIPEVSADRAERLSSLAAQAQAAAEDGESDGSQLRFDYDLRGYTQ
jgi:hypothetical protein